MTDVTDTVEPVLDGTEVVITGNISASILPWFTVREGKLTICSDMYDFSKLEGKDTIKLYAYDKVDLFPLRPNFFVLTAFLRKVEMETAERTVFNVPTNLKLFFDGDCDGYEFLCENNDPDMVLSNLEISATAIRTKFGNGKIKVSSPGNIYYLLIPKHLVTFSKNLGSQKTPV